MARAQQDHLQHLAPLDLLLGAVGGGSDAAHHAGGRQAVDVGVGPGLGAGGGHVGEVHGGGGGDLDAHLAADDRAAAGIGGEGDGDGAAVAGGGHIGDGAQAGVAGDGADIGELVAGGDLGAGDAGPVLIEGAAGGGAEGQVGHREHVGADAEEVGGVEGHASAGAGQGDSDFLNGNAEGHLAVVAQVTAAVIASELHGVAAALAVGHIGHIRQGLAAGLAVSGKEVAVHILAGQLSALLSLLVVVVVQGAVGGNIQELDLQGLGGGAHGILVVVQEVVAIQGHRLVVDGVGDGLGLILGVQNHQGTPQVLGALGAGGGGAVGGEADGHGAGVALLGLKGDLVQADLLALGVHIALVAAAELVAVAVHQGAVAAVDLLKGHILQGALGVLVLPEVLEVVRVQVHVVVHHGGVDHVASGGRALLHVEGDGAGVRIAPRVIRPEYERGGTRVVLAVRSEDDIL